MTRAAQSPVMNWLRSLGFERLAWSLRRFHCPVSADELVLEVGSGGNPYPRSNVLLDAYETTRERHWAPLSADRSTVLGFVENLPFRDQAFDFVIAAHVLEHSTQPEQFLSELQRVARAGYIEVPDAFLERVNPYRDHRLEVTCRDGNLLIRKKASWRPDEEVVELYEDRVKSVMTKSLVPSHPFEFHVRYYWENKISFRVINPEVDAGWAPPESNPHGGSVGGLRAQIRDLLRWSLSQRRRNTGIDLNALLRCPSCHATDLTRAPDNLRCVPCGTVYPVRRGIVAMNEGRPRD